MDSVRQAPVGSAGWRVEDRSDSDMIDSTIMIRVVAHFKPKAGKLEEACQLLLGFCAPTRQEKGCVYYDLHENTGDPEDLTFIEEWESEEDLDAHGKSAHIQEGRRKMPELMDVVDVRRYRFIG
jgi:quinol monooxygenase YgiN